MILVYHIYRVGCFVNIYQALIDQTVGKGVIFSFLIVCHRDKKFDTKTLLGLYSSYNFEILEILDKSLNFLIYNIGVL